MKLFVLLLVLIGVVSVVGDSFGHWFDDQHAEIIDTPVTLSVQFFNGATSLPQSLITNSALIRLGPTVLNTAKANYTNYIDGFGRISKWSFNGAKDQIHFQSSLIKSTLWNNSMSGTDIPPHITSEKVNPSRFDIVQLKNMDNTDVFPYQFPTKKDTITLSTDFYQTNQIHYESLRTLGATQFNDNGVDGTFSSSHSAEYVDSSTKKLYRVNWLGQKDLTGTSIKMFKMSDDNIRHVVGSYHLGYLPYSVHTVMVVGDYAIMYVSPVQLQFLETGFDSCISCSISDKLTSEDSQFIIFDLKSTDSKAKPIAVINTPKASNFFVFHYANGKFTDGTHRKIDLDVCSYNSMEGVLGKHVLGNLKDALSPTVRDSMPYNCDNVKRVTLDLDAKTISSRLDFPLQDKAGHAYRVELLSINNNFNGKDYCYVYGLAYHANGSPRYEDMGIVKINICTAKAVASGALAANTPTLEVFSQSNVYLGEPIFVPNVGSTVEDDGHLLVVSRDGNDNKSKLLVINAKSMTLVASATAPFPLMFEFHGAFFSEK
jgi:carotenoid cleavage dioxygenase-like enzyme